MALAIISISIVCLAAVILTAVAISKEWITDYAPSFQLYLQIFLFVFTLLTTIFYAYDVTKEPENYTDFCQKVVKANAKKPAELHRIRLEKQKAILTKERTELEKLLKKVEEKDRSDTRRQRRQQSGREYSDNNETISLDWQPDQGLEENGTPEEQSQVQKQLSYKTKRIEVEKKKRDDEKTTIPKIERLWNKTQEIEERSFERRKAKLKLDIKENRLKQDKALGVESEDTSIEEEKKIHNKYVALDQKEETEWQKEKCDLVDEVKKNSLSQKYH